MFPATYSKGRSKSSSSIACAVALLAAAVSLTNFNPAASARVNALPPFVAAPAPAAAPAVNAFVVNKTGNQSDANTADNLCDTDAGVAGDQCTLPAAIRQANATANAAGGADQINFNIPASEPGCAAATGVCSLAVTTLPTVTGAVIIDGYTQPGASANTLAVGSNAVVLIAFNVAGNGLQIDTGACASVVRGLSVSANSNAIVLNGTTNVLVEGNRIGVDAAGTTGVNYTGGNTGVLVTEAGGPASANVIGGASPAQRNVIGAVAAGINISRAGGSAGSNSIVNNYVGMNAAGTVGLNGNGGGFNTVGINVGGGAGVNIEGNVVGAASTGVGISNVTAGTVRGNRVGTNAAGTAAIPNAVGVGVSGTGQTIVGGTTEADRNVISGNTSGIGVNLNADGQIVQGNYIGTTADGLSPLPNGNGVRIGFVITFNGNMTRVGNRPRRAAAPGKRP